jgi:hypothetical protein
MWFSVMGRKGREETTQEAGKPLPYPTRALCTVLG